MQMAADRWRRGGMLGPIMDWVLRAQRPGRNGRTLGELVGRCHQGQGMVPDCSAAPRAEEGPRAESRPLRPRFAPHVEGGGWAVLRADGAAVLWDLSAWVVFAVLEMVVPVDGPARPLEVLPELAVAPEEPSIVLPAASVGGSLVEEKQAASAEAPRVEAVAESFCQKRVLVVPIGPGCRPSLSVVALVVWTRIPVEVARVYSAPDEAAATPVPECLGRVGTANRESGLATAVGASLAVAAVVMSALACAEE